MTSSYRSHYMRDVFVVRLGAQNQNPTHET
jgi:hypothetical protein